MISLAAETGSGSGVFLLIWSIVALLMGGALATKRWSARFKSLIVGGLAGNPVSQQRAVRNPVGFLRLIGGFFVVAGAVALPIAVVLIVRG